MLYKSGKYCLGSPGYLFWTFVKTRNWFSYISLAQHCFHWLPPGFFFSFFFYLKASNSEFQHCGLTSTPFFYGYVLYSAASFLTSSHSYPISSCQLLLISRCTKIGGDSLVFLRSTRISSQEVRLQLFLWNNSYAQLFDKVALISGTSSLLLISGLDIFLGGGGDQVYGQAWE